MRRRTLRHLVLLWLLMAFVSARAQLPDDFKGYECQNASKLYDLFAKSSLQDPISNDMLLLSGGGSRGAWGAGFLHGWSPSKRFRVVTGVSTGALQATHAFVGSPDSLAELLALYSEIADSSIQKKRFFPFVPFSSSARKLAPLKRLLRDKIPDHLIDQVGAEAGSRLLCVGVVGLRSGSFMAVDLTELAHDKRYELYRKAILASASAPVIYAPVRSGNELYVDGGAREQVFAAVLMLARLYNAAVLSDPAAAGGEGDQSVYIIVNGKLDFEADDVSPRLVPIATRVVSILLDQVMWGNLYRVQYFLTEDSIGKQLASRWHFKVSYIPGTYKMTFDSFEFPQPAMKELAKEGEQAGKESRFTDLSRLLRRASTF